MQDSIDHYLREYHTQNNTTDEPYKWENGIDILKSTITRSEEIQNAELNDEITIVNLACLSIGFLAMAAWERDEENRILDQDFPAKDLFLATWLTNISNTGRSIVRLSEEGFDTQARMLVRCLHERTRQAIIVLYSGDDYQAWHESDSGDDGKSSYYKLFSKKDRLNRRYHAIEQELSGGVIDFNHDLIRDRKNSDSFFSQAVHGSSLSVLVGAFAAKHNSDDVGPAIFGQASSSSKSTLMHTHYDLLYFSLILHQLLKTVHSWVPDEQCRLTNAHLAHNYCLIELSKPIITNWNEQETSPN